MKIATTQIWVHDQDEALAFYTQKLGFEVREDVTMPELGNFRWLTVAPAGSDVALVLMAIPGPPAFDDERFKAAQEAMSKGVATAVFFTTDDIQGEYETLRARGVEFTEPPEERPYGIDCGFRDPSGNHFRLSQLTQVATPA
ncbi:catechol 2,3-dioxygenase-like lactoylglutathione lyase family enzyme [Solirubrobacter pauli]|uniref:Catechol 2,3-dioxygenase-like lactoylglutathione lyase family enzyme n=1 Tax=Solirubrobacter pauli TaxID=166793 RepID=A0A660LE64_9ACTN|nr:VOC family protein [Solirubrobacter pauli]RKQ93388.1 catechol 2,3-dioxygenase-like lactoylglutathione lyase family enzyme [Solirubrobacter pauli]